MDEEGKPRTIGLAMIVRNEAHVIRRCLESVLPIVDYVLICDTGSSDGTETVTSEFLQAHDLPGAIVREPWRDFGYNRTIVLEQIRHRPEIDYVLVIDADDMLTFGPEFVPSRFKQFLTADAYDLRANINGYEYMRRLIFRNSMPFYFRGVIHEYLDCRQRYTHALADGIFYTALGGGGRSHNPNKYYDDAQVIENALRTESDQTLRARYLFYLGQSYRLARYYKEALAAYTSRSVLGSNVEEVYLSLYRAGQLKERLGWPVPEVLDAFLMAHRTLSSRAEALYGAVCLCRRNEHWELAYRLAKRALTISRPDRGLFIQRSIYDYRLLYEYSIAAHKTQRFEETYKACSRLLREGTMPGDKRASVRQRAAAAVLRSELLGEH